MSEIEGFHIALYHIGRLFTNAKEAIKGRKKHGGKKKALGCRRVGVVKRVYEVV